jgi:hypothetical protein
MGVADQLEIFSTSLLKEGSGQHLLTVLLLIPFNHLPWLRMVEEFSSQGVSGDLIIGSILEYAIFASTALIISFGNTNFSLIMIELEFELVMVSKDNLALLILVGVPWGCS